MLQSWDEQRENRRAESRLVRVSRAIAVLAIVAVGVLSAMRVL